MHLFYIPQLIGAHAVLSEEESKHCINVLRMKAGDELILVDGVGGYYTARIKIDHPKKCKVEIRETVKEFKKRNFYLHLACAPTKNSERFEWFLEKATEIGIDAITPLNCEHSERTTVKPERLEKVIISAMKQSVKAYKPKLNESISFKNFIAENKNYSGQKFIAHCHDSTKKNLQDAYTPYTNVLILIGPEGDFSKVEIDLAIAADFIPINLSTSRLRTETAAIMACATVNLLNSR